MRKSKLFSFLIFSILSFGKIIATPIELDRNTDLAINKFVLVKNDTGWKLNKTKQEVLFGFDQHIGLGRFTLKNCDIAQDYAIVFQQSRMDNIVFFKELDSLGLCDTIGSIDKSIGIGNRPMHSVDFVFKIHLQQNEIASFRFLTTRKFGSHAAIVHVKSIDSFESHQVYFTSYISFIVGVCVVVCLAGLFLYFFFNQVAYLVYSLYCFCSGLVTLADAGFFHGFFPSQSFLYLHNNITTVAFYWVVGSHIILTMVLLNLKKRLQPFLFYTGCTLSSLFILLGFVVLYSDLSENLRSGIIFISYYIVFMMDIYVITVLINGIINKQRLVYFYLAGFLFTIIGSTVLILANIGIIDGINQNYDFGYAIPLVEIFCMLIGVSFHFSEQNRKYISTQLELNESQKQVISIQELQQKRIAQDLHDGIGQELLLLKRNLKQQQMDTHSVENIIESVRLVSRELYPVSLEKIGLKAAIENLSQQIMELDAIFIHCEINYFQTLSPQHELQVFRIFQEAINNTLKYAQAKALKLTLDEQKEYIVISIHDNGKGFDVNDKLMSKSSFGLQSMLQRTKSMNGTFDISSSAAGSLIAIKIPKT